MIPPPKVRGNGARLCAEHQPQRHGEATRFGIIRRLLASVLAAAGPSDTAALRWWFHAPPAEGLRRRHWTRDRLRVISWSFSAGRQRLNLKVERAPRLRGKQCNELDQLTQGFTGGH